MGNRRRVYITRNTHTSWHLSQEIFTTEVIKYSLNLSFWCFDDWKYILRFPANSYIIIIDSTTNYVHIDIVYTVICVLDLFFSKSIYLVGYWYFSDQNTKFTCLYEETYDFLFNLLCTFLHVLQTVSQ